MDIGQNAITKAEMMIARLEMRPDSYVSFIYNDDTDGDTELMRLTVTDSDVDWDATEVKNLYVAVAFIRLRILDYEGFEEIISKTEKFEIDGEMFKIDKTEKPFGQLRLWTFKLVEMSDL